MACHHPPEELQRAYDGGPTPLPGRFFCSLCGEPVYAMPAAPRRQPGSAAAVLHLVDALHRARTVEDAG